MAHAVELINICIHRAIEVPFVHTLLSRAHENKNNQARRIYDNLTLLENLSSPSLPNTPNNPSTSAAASKLTYCSTVRDFLKEANATVYKLYKEVIQSSSLPSDTGAKESSGDSTDLTSSSNLFSQRKTQSLQFNRLVEQLEAIRNMFQDVPEIITQPGRSLILRRLLFDADQICT